MDASQLTIDSDNYAAFVEYVKSGGSSYLVTQKPQLDFAKVLDPCSLQLIKLTLSRAQE